MSAAITEEQIERFVTAWFQALDQHLPLEGVRRFLADSDLEMIFPEHLSAWTLQGLWVTFTAAAALAGITTTTRKGLGWFALPVLRGWQFVSLISPLFVTLLLTRVSGVPMLEKRADEKWGGWEDYEAYKERTPVLIPRAPKMTSKGG
jgi:hypothetical protein